MTYSITTWDPEEEDFTPQEGVPSHGLTLHQLRRSMRMLRSMGYSVHRRRTRYRGGWEYYDSDFSVLIERTSCG